MKKFDFKNLLKIDTNENKWWCDVNKIDDVIFHWYVNTTWDSRIIIYDPTRVGVGNLNRNYIILKIVVYIL